MPFGRDVFINACKYMLVRGKGHPEKNRLTPEQIVHLIPHQANSRIIAQLVEALGLHNGELITNIEKTGNTGCASTAIALSQNWRRFLKSELIVVGCFRWWVLERRDALKNEAVNMEPRTLPSLVIKGKTISIPIVQGGMGVGVSLSPLASAVAEQGGVGIVSSAALDRLLTKRTGKKHTSYEAAYEEISLAKARGGVSGINIMVALIQDYEDSVKGAIDAGADVIISGAGLPLNLPAIKNPGETALIPIVSSARALEIICKKWERLGYRPDAVVLEGPLAGGHLGFKPEEIDIESNKLENLLPPVKEMADKYGGFPVIVAGGIYTHDDIVRFLKMGADGVQMGTRFLVARECSATDAYKQAVIDAGKEDILVSQTPVPPVACHSWLSENPSCFGAPSNEKEGLGAIRGMC